MNRGSVTVCLLHRLAAVIAFSIACYPACAITASDLRCEQQTSPLAIDSVHPRLSWNLHSQLRGDHAVRYHILAAESLQGINRNRGDLWDAELKGVNSINIAYSGKPLHSGQTVFWKVQAVDSKGKIGPWSAPARWEMGLLSQADWQAKWIGDGKENPVRDADFYKTDPAPLFRTEFKSQSAPIKGRLTISGIGYYEARINGHKVGDAMLAPAWTNYSKRVSYTVYDVTAMLHNGGNCMGVTLGNGWYNLLPLRMWGTYNLRNTLPVGRPKFIAKLTLTFKDGSVKTVVSDDSWSVTEGPLQFNSIYLGEVYDASREKTGWDSPGYTQTDWRRATVVVPPAGVMEAQYQPPIRVTRQLPTKAVSEPKPGFYIFDMGQNFAGLVRLKLSAPAGTRIVLRYGELLNKDGTLNPMTSVAGQIKGNRRLADGSLESVGGPGAPTIAWQTDTYIAKGTGVESYTPQFTFHGFRYVEVTGCPLPPRPDMLLGLRMNSDVERTGIFSCDLPQVNRIQEMCDNTFLSNIFSVQSDCPHRERFGYGGDLVATCDAFIMNYDMSRFYAKSVRDWADAALPDGMLTDTAPFVGIQYCGVAWAMAHPLVQRRLYQYYGDSRLIEEQYPISRKWLDLVDRQFPDHIITSGLSDHEFIAPADAPALLTPLYASAAQIVSELAKISSRASTGTVRAGLIEDQARFMHLSTETTAAYRKKFVLPDGQIANNTVAAFAFATELNSVSGELKKTVAKKLDQEAIRAYQHQTLPGIFGTNYMLDGLSQNGYGADAARMVTHVGIASASGNNSSPDWINMLDKGATTLWEHWQGSDNTFSQNHPMFGSVSQWLCQWIGGIAPSPDAVGFNRIEIHPLIGCGVGSASYQYRSVRGNISCNWKSTGPASALSSVDLTIEVPVGASGELTLPVAVTDRCITVKTWCFDKPISDQSFNNGKMHLESGRYRIQLSAP